MQLIHPAPIRSGPLERIVWRALPMLPDQMLAVREQKCKRICEPDYACQPRARGGMLEPLVGSLVETRGRRPDSEGNEGKAEANCGKRLQPGHRNENVGARPNQGRDA